jgi:hypothetical protein
MVCVWQVELRVEERMTVVAVQVGRKPYELLARQVAGTEYSGTAAPAFYEVTAVLHHSVTELQI